MIRKTFTVRWPIVIVLVSAGLVLMAILFIRPKASSEAPIDELAWVEASNPQYNFAVDYPTKWTAETYGPDGNRGADDMKLEVYQRFFGNFRIFIYLRESRQPTLEQVSRWGQERIKVANGNISRRGEPAWESIDTWTETLGDREVIRHRYGNESITNEDVYFAREKDIVIIRLQSDSGAFNGYVEDFNRLVASFRPPF